VTRAEKMAAISTIRQLSSKYASRNGSAPSGEGTVQKTEAPPSAIEYLKAHPETKAAFFKKYGYLPRGK
jgi:hypothetical protein